MTSAAPIAKRLVRIASAIEPAWLEELFPGKIRRERQWYTIAQRDRVVGRGATYYRDLPLAGRCGCGG